MAEQITTEYTLRHRLRDCDRHDLRGRIENLEVFATAMASALANITHYAMATNHGHSPEDRDELIALSIIDTMGIMAQSFSAMVTEFGVTDIDHIGVALAKLDLRNREARGEKHDA